jgi:hypothetical protein
MKKFVATLFISIFIIAGLSAQELNCSVIVNADMVENQERRIFTDMETAFSQFLNNRKWTDNNFEPEERIRCQMIIGIKRQPSVGSFLATVQIQSVRPVYNTNLETSLLALTQNYADQDWQFEYTESQPLDFNINNFTNNITSILAYYAYMIIAMDYDSFAKLGGTPYYEQAFTIVNNAQQTGRSGWQQFVNPPRNRYWLIENLMNPQFRDLREGFYQYHRLGLDKFLSNPDEARATILEVLEKLQTAYQSRQNSFLIILFMYAKSNELINIFSEGDINVRRQAYEILIEVDPTKADDYQQILQGG